jgi:hypothetical protein
MSSEQVFIFVDIESAEYSQSLWINKDIAYSSKIVLGDDPRVWTVKKVYEGTEKKLDSINNRIIFIRRYRRCKYGYTKQRPFVESVREMLISWWPDR